MQIDTNVSLDELSDNHPVTDVLNEREQALYLSAVQSIVEAAEDIEENCAVNQGKFDPGAPELAETTDQLRASITLSDLIEEVAAGRKQSFSEDDHNRAGER